MTVRWGVRRATGDRDRRSGQRGQSTVEFALILPLMLVIVLATVQIGLVVVAKLSVTHTAREVARVLVVDPSADADGVARRAAPWVGDELSVQVTRRASSVADRPFVAVQVRDRVPTITGFWPLDVEVSSTAVMLSEEP